MANVDGIFGQYTDKLLDVLSIGSLAAFVLGVLPVISLVLTVVWTAIRIYETATIQRFIKRRRRIQRIKRYERKSARQPTSR